MDMPTREFDTPPALTARALTHRYGELTALADVDIDVPAGQICAVLGHNGAGKTTLIHCALGLVAATHGDVRVLGAPAGSRDARLATGVMLQDTDLGDLLSAREHLTLFSRYYGTGANVDAVIESAGIAAFADIRYKRLSGGQKRRVQFAVAVVGQPRLLFLDEPTTGLDVTARRAVWDNVRRLAAGGTTVVLTTHYLEEADALADRIVVLHQGRIVADDDPAGIRRRTGGAIVRCRTRLSADGALDLPGVHAAETHGRLLTLRCDHAPTTLRALLDRDPDLDELEVSKPTLEQAFAALSDDAPAPHEEPA